MIEPPEYAALINPIAGNAFAMRYVGRKDFVQNLTIDTGPQNWLTPITVELFDGLMYETEPCDSLMFISPFVKLVTAVPADYAAQLLIARLTVVLEGEIVVDKGLLEKFLVAPPFQIAETSDSGQRLVYVGRNEDSLIGGCNLAFTSRKPTLSMRLEGLPAGIGVIRLIYGAILGHYTTRAKTGGLFAVGKLDAQQQVYPVSTRWEEPQKGDITEDKLERAYGDVLKGLLREKEAEIRRLKEDADLREKAEKRRVELEAEKKTIEELYARNAELVGEKLCDRGISVRPDELPLVIRPEGKVITETPVNFEAALARAKKRLVRWGIIAALALLAAAVAIRFLVL